MTEHGLDHRLRLQRRAGIVEVDHVRAARRLRAYAPDIDHERFSLVRSDIFRSRSFTRHARACPAHPRVLPPKDNVDGRNKSGHGGETKAKRTRWIKRIGRRSRE